MLVAELRGIWLISVSRRSTSSGAERACGTSRLEPLGWELVPGEQSVHGGPCDALIFVGHVGVLIDEFKNSGMSSCGGIHRGKERQFVRVSLSRDVDPFEGSRDGLFPPRVGTFALVLAPLRLPALVLLPILSAIPAFRTRSRPRGRPRTPPRGPWSRATTGRLTGTPRMSAWICMARSLRRDAPVDTHDLQAAPRRPAASP